MSRIRRPRECFIHSLTFTALLALTPQLSFAQDVLLEIPEHSSARSYGGGWSCDQGYRNVNDLCAAVDVPANAYATNRSYGSGWECDYGHRLTEGGCVSVVVPPNAYLESTGSRWACDRGHQRLGQTC
jgi:hypothetical protein